MGDAGTDVSDAEGAVALGDGPTLVLCGFSWTGQPAPKLSIAARTGTAMSRNVRIEGLTGSRIPNL